MSAIDYAPLGSTQVKANEQANDHPSGALPEQTPALKVAALMARAAWTEEDRVIFGALPASVQAAYIKSDQRDADYMFVCVQ